MANKWKDVTVIIPAFNEAPRISKIVKLASKKTNVIVVDDGSADGTSDVVKNLKLKNVKLIRHKKNKGKSVAVSTALNKTKSKFVLFLDADLVGLKLEHLDLLVNPSADSTMVVALRDRYGPVAQQLMKLIPIAGERVVEVDVARKLSKYKLWRAYNMELMLNRDYRKNGKICFVKLAGLTHTTKASKWGSYGAREWISWLWSYFVFFLTPKK